MHLDLAPLWPSSRVASAKLLTVSAGNLLCTVVQPQDKVDAKSDCMPAAAYVLPIPGHGCLGVGGGRSCLLGQESQLSTVG